METRPSYSCALTATDQHTPPQPTNTIHKHTQLTGVTGDGMVLVVTQHNLPEPDTDLGRTMMLPALKFSLNGFELRSHPLLRCNPPDDEWPCRELSTEMREAQKREGRGFPLATPLTSSCSKPPELDQSCFVRMQFQTELGQPLSKFFQELLRFCSVLEAHH